MNPRPRARNHGFTLIEVLVAVGILAVALAAAARATSISIEGAIDARERMLAMWVAQDRLAEHQALRAFPDAGDTTNETEQAGVRFRWTETVSATPNPFFRRVDIRVYSPRSTEYVVARLVGFVNRTN